jgi:hypothetical protein
VAGLQALVGLIPCGGVILRQGSDCRTAGRCETVHGHVQRWDYRFSYDLAEYRANLTRPPWFPAFGKGWCSRGGESWDFQHRLLRDRLGLDLDDEGTLFAGSS